MQRPFHQQVFRAAGRASVAPVPSGVVGPHPACAEGKLTKLTDAVDEGQSDNPRKKISAVTFAATHLGEVRQVGLATKRLTTVNIVNIRAPLQLCATTRSAS